MDIINLINIKNCWRQFLSAFFIVSVLVLFSSCSLVERGQRFKPYGDVQWIEKSKSDNYRVYGKSFIKNKSDTLDLSIACINNDLVLLAFGPPYIPIIPDVLFFLGKRDTIIY